MTAPETAFLLVRHGATAHTAQRRFSGGSGANPPLSDLGQRQAAALASNLSADDPQREISAVVSSPIRRAVQTAKVLADALHLPTTVDVDLREIDFGQWEGLTSDEVEHGWPGGLAAFRADAGAKPPDGEAVTHVAERVRRVRTGLAERHPGATVLVVSHLYPVRLSVLDALGAPHKSVHHMQHEPTGVSEVRVTGGIAHLVRYNDVTHLRQL